jgi:tetratricopeptide (TPR) repeat protein
MQARITIVGNDILCGRGAVRAGEESRIELTGATLARLTGWAERYGRIVRTGDPSPLLALGLEIFAWLDQGGWASGWIRGTGDRVLEVAVDDPGTEAAAALLDLPWETLAREGGFLAADPAQTLVVFRSIGRRADAAPAQPAHRDLEALFMAAAPRGQRELGFEAEEAAILDATARLPMQLFVEESGCADFLKDRLAQDGPFEAVHLSCHGDILEATGPVLALETPEGDLAPVTPGQLAGVLGERKAPLVFLSACRTAEGGERRDADGKPEAVEPFARALVRAGVANVLGWDGSVYDLDATRFARAFYGELAERATVPYAAAVARREVLREHHNDPRTGRHWHLARVYAGPLGAGPLCDAAKPRRRLRKAAGYREFLDKADRRVPVATAEEFVGRRRHAQAVLRAFRENDKPGVLIHGMGNLGKSSLAARIANRMPGHQTVVVFERYDALAVFEQLLRALPGSERGRWEQEWRERIGFRGAALADALEEMLNGPLDADPVLLVIDDLEQVLETPRPGQSATPVRDAPGSPDAWRDALSAVLRAFGAAATESRLLLTSRYVFTLPDGRGRDLADRLEHVQLPPMDKQERAKQWRAAERAAGHDEVRPGDPEAALVARALAAAGGNPGLQEILCRPILAGEPDAAGRAVEAVERWRDSGRAPEEESAAQEFFRRVSLETYRDALTETQRVQLRAATLFSEGVPVPLETLEAVGRAAGVADPRAAVARLLGLGLVDGWGEIDGVEHGEVNPLARPLAGDRLSEAEQAHLAAAAIPPLASAWRNANGDFPFDPRGVEAARLALAGSAPSDILDRAVYAAGTFLFRGEHDAKTALEYLAPALAKIAGSGGEPRPEFLLLAANCAERLGETELQISWLEKGLTLRYGNESAIAQIAAMHAVATVARHGPETALATLRTSAELFGKAGDARSRAIALGQIADILVQRGETAEALRIRREEQLPVFELLGDVRSRAVSMSKIADTLAQRGETEEALRILCEEQLPVYEQLGDVRERAITLGQIADILVQRGETEEALRIRRDEELPVYERLGDVHSHAVTMGLIANILAERGEIEEALRIYTEEQLPVFDRLGAVSERAMTMGQISNILAKRGETEEGLRILREEQLPVFERLGDVRSRALTMGQIADILTLQGKTEEALRIHAEEQLPVFEQLGDVRSLAMTMGRIADILTQRGQTEEALRIRREEELPVYERLGDVRSRALTMGKIADILAERGEAEEALRIHTEERLPTAIATNDIDSIAHIRFSCAQLRLGRDGLAQGEAQTIVDELAESFAINKKLQRADGIAFVGWLLGQVLAIAGHTEDALAVLDQSAIAFEKLRQPEQAARIRALQQRIRENES